MKTFTIPLSVLLIALLSACGNPSSSTKPDSKDLKGTWTLFKETKQGKTIDYSGVPSASRIEFKENGYFVYFDQITDEKINKSNIGSIQDYLKGQYELKDGEILLNHYNQDTLVTKRLRLESLKENEMILKDERAGKLSYFKK